ncbi:hypothetical protein H6P81_009747 [Aristolochia fimbriata]|uniref:Uncharacterized protein n=1 Tax=Aristolochia fimbriata TaxID=158543 RepID=A0AAV7ELT7_ARIFI|nr:hypothetical protein H6P81_009747 [Aristolochia fimbriata]
MELFFILHTGACVTIVWFLSGLHQGKPESSGISELLIHIQGSLQTGFSPGGDSRSKLVPPRTYFFLRASEEIDHGIVFVVVELFEFAVRGVQVPAKEVHAGMHLRAVLPAGGAAEVRERAQDLRCEQCDEATERAAAAPEGGRGELAGVRGGGEDEGPRLRLRRRHLRPTAPGPPTPEGARRRQRRSHQPPQPPPHHHHHHHHHHQGLPHLAPLRQRSFEFGRRGSNISTSTTSSAAHGGSSSFYGGATTPALQLPNYPSTAPWSSNTGVDPTGDNMHTRGGGSAGGENSNM